MTVYEITFETKKILDFKKLEEEFDYSFKTKVLGESVTIIIGKEELDHRCKQTPEKNHTHILTINKRFIDFLRKANFEFEVTETEK